MDIDVRQLRQDPGRVERHEFLLRPQGFDYRGDHYELERPAAVRAQLEGARRSVRVGVAARLHLAGTCDRCLDPFGFVVTVDYAEVYLTPDQALAAGVRPEEGGDGQLRQVVYSGDRIELDEGLWQNVILALPMKRLCGPDCRGLCPRCGSNRNREGCGCTVGETDPRWTALQGLVRREGR